MASDMQPLADRSISTDADLPKEPVNQNLRETEKDPSCMSDSTRVSSSSTREESNSQISPRETETFEDKKKIISLVKSSKCLEELRRIAKLVQQGTVCIDLATDREVSFDLFILVAQISQTNTNCTRLISWCESDDPDSDDCDTIWISGVCRYEIPAGISDDTCREMLKSCSYVAKKPLKARKSHGADSLFQCGAACGMYLKHDDLQRLNCDGIASQKSPWGQFLGYTEHNVLLSQEELIKSFI